MNNNINQNIEEIAKNIVRTHLQNKGISDKLIEQILSKYWHEIYKICGQKIENVTIEKSYENLNNYILYQCLCNEFNQPHYYKPCTLTGYDKNHHIRIQIKNLNYHTLFHHLEHKHGKPIMDIDILNLTYVITIENKEIPIYTNIPKDTTKDYVLCLPSIQSPTNNQKKYSIVAYDKDHDVWDELTKVSTEQIAKQLGLQYNNYLEDKNITFVSESGEPYDWIEIWTDFNTINEKRIGYFDIVKMGMFPHTSTYIYFTPIKEGED